MTPQQIVQWRVDQVGAVLRAVALQQPVAGHAGAGAQFLQQATLAAAGFGREHNALAVARAGVAEDVL